VQRFQSTGGADGLAGGNFADNGWFMVFLR
jgi:hypothetical protein